MFNILKKKCIELFNLILRKNNKVNERFEDLFVVIYICTLEKNIYLFIDFL